MLNQKFYFVAKSTNKKTGNISQTYTDRTSCPTGCPFKLCGGCYAENCCCSFTWNRCELDIEELKKAVDSKKTTYVIRHNVAGDIAVPGTNDIDVELVKKLAEVYKGHKAYTYTHCAKSERNLAIIKQLKDKFVINASCENLEQVKTCLSHGVPCVLAVENMEDDVKVIDGITFKKCHGDCQNCSWCMGAYRNIVPVFEAHGSGRKKIINAKILIKSL